MVKTKTINLYHIRSHLYDITFYRFCQDVSTKNIKKKVVFINRLFVAEVKRQLVLRTVEEYVLRLEKNLGCEIVQLGYDRYNAVSSVRKFETAENAIECVEIKQHSSVLHPATKLLKERILQKQFVYDENLLLEINFSNARCTEDTNLNKYVNKKRSEGKVDMVVALINAVYLLNENELLTSEMDWAVQM